jgi:GNAT superfamily N-acetyltransferase
MDLAQSARREGHEFLFRMEAEWLDGTLRFDGPGECLFIARHGDKLIGLSGICRDPYQPRDDVGRLRHVYVERPFRSRGLARELVFACLAATGARFHIIRLKTLNPVAARLYERVGF